MATKLSRKDLIIEIKRFLSMNDENVNIESCGVFINIQSINEIKKIVNIRYGAAYNVILDIEDYGLIMLDDLSTFDIENIFTRVCL